MSDAGTNNHEQALADFRSSCSKFGNEAKHGADALPKLAMAIVEATVAGIITDEADSDGVDDFQRAYDWYATAESNKPIHEHTANGLKSNRSKFRQVGRYASSSTLKDPIGHFENAIEVRNTMATEDGTRVYSAFPALVNFCRAQLKADTALTVDEMRESMRKPDPIDKTVEDVVRQAEKITADLITGERKDGLECQHDDLVSAQSYLSSFLATLVSAREIKELHERAAELGVTLGDEGELPSADEVVEARIVKKEDV